MFGSFNRASVIVSPDKRLSGLALGGSPAAALAVEVMLALAIFSCLYTADGFLFLRVCILRSLRDKVAGDCERLMSNNSHDQANHTASDLSQATSCEQHAPLVYGLIEKPNR